jgi:hypothetical protein
MITNSRSAIVLHELFFTDCTRQTLAKTTHVTGKYEFYDIFIFIYEQANYLLFYELMIIAVSSIIRSCSMSLAIV